MTARAPAMRAPSGRAIWHSPRGGAQAGASGRQDRRSTAPHATPLRRRLAGAAELERRSADPRSASTDRYGDQSGTTGARSQRAVTPRRGCRRRRARLAQSCPSSESCRRACGPSPRASVARTVRVRQLGRRRPCRRRTPAEGPRSDPDSTALSAGAVALASRTAVWVMSRPSSAPTAGDGRAHPPRP